MKLQEYALVAEILSAVAVVASLIFVAFQIQQQAEETALNTRAIQVSAYQDLVAQIATLNLIIIQDAEFAELRIKILGGGAPNDNVEQARFRAYISLAVRHGDLAYRQYRNGLIDELSLRSVLAPLLRFLRLADVSRSQWEFMKPALDTDYVSFINALLEEGAFNEG